MFAFVQTVEDEVELEKPIAYVLHTFEYAVLNSLLVDCVNLQVDEINGKLLPQRR